jgi:uncharacterized protein YdaU (DUF1376 family)
MMSKKEKKDVKVVLEYMWRDEERHYQEGPCKNHIFVILRRLAKRVGFEGA